MNCLSTPYLIEAVGSSKFANANGILNLFRGLGCFFGPYLAGKKIFNFYIILFLNYARELHKTSSII